MSSSNQHQQQQSQNQQQAQQQQQAPAFETSFANDVKWNTSGTSSSTTSAVGGGNNDHSIHSNQQSNISTAGNSNTVNNFDPLHSSASVGHRGGGGGEDDGQFDANANNTSTGQINVNNNNNNNNQDTSPPEDLNLFISDLLEQMQSKFENMGNTIINRIDDMGSRIDTLEKSIGDLMDQSGLSEPTYGSVGNNINKKGGSAIDHSDD